MPKGQEPERSVARDVLSRLNSWYQNNNFDALKASTVNDLNMGWN